MSMVDFCAIAENCKKRYISKLRYSNQHYLRTLYVCISEHDDVSYSTSPLILKDPKPFKCLLIHQREDLAITNWHKFYDVEYIDSLGGVTDGVLGDGFKIIGHAADPYESLRLLYCNRVLYSCTSPHENHIKKIWKLYNEYKSLNIKSKMLFQEIIDKIDKKDEAVKKINELTNNIKTLEIERDKYLKIIEKIREEVM